MLRMTVDNYILLKEQENACVCRCLSGAIKLFNNLHVLLLRNTCAISLFSPKNVILITMSSKRDE